MTNSVHSWAIHKSLVVLAALALSTLPAAAQADESKGERLAALTAKTAAFEIVEMRTRYVVTKTANLRQGPSTDYAKVGKLPAGVEITVTGKVKDANWYRIAGAGEAAAFIYGALIRDATTPAPKTASKVSPQLKSGIDIIPQRQELLAMKDTTVHVSPDTASKVLEPVYASAYVVVTGKIRGTNWFRIARRGGREGYVHAPDFRARTGTYLP